MKNLIFALTLCLATPLYSQRETQQSGHKAALNCEEQEHALESGVYVYAVMDHIWVPGSPPPVPVGNGITLAVQFWPEGKVFLHTKGTKFELWLGTPDVPGNNIWDFLEDAADSCKLPPDPAEAVKLLKVHWEVETLTREQFERLHGDFLAALTEYISTIRERSAYFMAKGLQGGGVDASGYRIVYDNSWEHVEIHELDLPIDGQPSPMIKWVREFQSAAEQTFHRQLGRKAQSDKGSH
ncbi:MAG: hypothetical protein WA254_17140 [Candidatus Sulfotelmatobacter sp.]